MQAHIGSGVYSTVRLSVDAVLEVLVTSLLNLKFLPPVFINSGKGCCYQRMVAQNWQSVFSPSLYLPALAITLIVTGLMMPVGMYTGNFIVVVLPASTLNTCCSSIVFAKLLNCWLVVASKMRRKQSQRLPNRTGY